MNQLIKSLLFTGILCFFYLAGNAQVSKFSQGQIVYETSFPDTTESSTVSGYAFPAEINLYLKNSIYKADINSLYVSASVFTDLSARTSVSYMQVTGKKVRITSNLDSMLLQAYARTPYTLEPSAGTMKISGYTCKKLIARFFNRGIPDAVIYYTPEIPFMAVPATQAFTKVPGFIMYIEENYQGLNLHLKVKQVNDLPLAESVFTQPAGFQSYSASEIFNALGKPF